jgi:hypothetical protein
MPLDPFMQAAPDIPAFGPEKGLETKQSDQMQRGDVILDNRLIRKDAAIRFPKTRTAGGFKGTSCQDDNGDVDFSSPYYYWHTPQTITIY